MGISHEIKKSIFNIGLEGKLMKTINAPIFIKDFSKESENIINLNQLLNNFSDLQIKRKLIMNLTIKNVFKRALPKYILNLKTHQYLFMAYITLGYNMEIISQT